MKYGYLLGPTPTWDKVPHVGFLVVRIVHKNGSLRLVEAMEPIS